MPSTTVDLVIRLRVPGDPQVVATYLDSLYRLADAMAARAYAGLWTPSHPDSPPSRLIAEIDSTRVQAVLIEGIARSATDRKGNS